MPSSPVLVLVDPRAQRRAAIRARAGYLVQRFLGGAIGGLIVAFCAVLYLRSF